MINDRPDNPLGTKDAESPGGNHVVLKLAERRFVFLAHMQRGSVPVKPGDAVRRGQRLGVCGNSGNSDFPHVHLHVQDTPDLNKGRGQTAVFGPINVELSGKQFPGVSWPLIRGSSVPQARYRSLSLPLVRTEFSRRPGMCFARWKSASLSRPELNSPTHAKASGLRSPMVNAWPPPIDSPTIARDSRPDATR